MWVARHGHGDSFYNAGGYLIAQSIRHVYLVTSDYHMARAKTIAVVFFGGCEVEIASIAQPPKYQSSEEFWVKVMRDGLRALMLLVTARSGARFNPRLQVEASCRF